MRLFVDNLMSHKLAFTYYSYFDTLSLVTHTLNIPFITFSPSISCERGSPPGFHRTTVSANTGYVQATINKTDPHTNHFRLSIGGVWDTSSASVVSASQINIEPGLTKLERRYGLKSNS